MTKVYKLYQGWEIFPEFKKNNRGYLLSGFFSYFLATALSPERSEKLVDLTGRFFVVSRRQ